MKLSPSGESAMERVHSDALHEQKEMGWIEPALVTHCGVCQRVDVGARAASGGDKVLWECIDPYEAEVRNHATSSGRQNGRAPLCFRRMAKAAHPLLCSSFQIRNAVSDLVYKRVPPSPQGEGFG
ncbi:MAG: hypothetical protein HPZ79_08595 [Oscillospiraceae bacterium]|nr:hypothetical protein [Oscillospiraceae bacterium]